MRSYNNRVSIGKDTKVLAMEKFILEHDLFCISVIDIKNNNVKISEYFLCTLSECDLWHFRLGHPGKSKIEQIIKMGLISDLTKVELTPCEHCLVRKMTKKSFSVGYKSQELLELVHSDICSSLSTKTYNNKEYFITFIDDYSKFAYVYLIFAKSEVFDCFRKYRMEVEKQLGRNIKVLRTDRGGEYNSKEFESYCQEYGIRRYMTMLYTP